MEIIFPTSILLISFLLILYLIFVLYIYSGKIYDEIKYLKRGLITPEENRKDAYNWMLATIIIYIICEIIYLSGFFFYVPHGIPVFVVMVRNTSYWVFVLHGFLLIHSFHGIPTFKDKLFLKCSFLVVIQGVIIICSWVLVYVYITTNPNYELSFIAPIPPTIYYLCCILFGAHMYLKKLLNNRNLMVVCKQ